MSSGKGFLPRLWIDLKIYCYNGGNGYKAHVSKYGESPQYLSLEEHSAEMQEKDAEIARLREALEESAGALSIRADDILHYFEDGCLPTKDEVDMAKSAYLEAKEALSKGSE